MHLDETHPLTAHGTAQSRLIRALRGERPDVTPVWFMRQAGRSLPEYRALRAHQNMLEACLSPAVASEITVQPVRRHAVDAAIFFSDIVIPLKLAGLSVEIVPGRGPVFAAPVQTSADVRALVAIDPNRIVERGEPIRAAVQQTTALLAEEADARGEPVPLIGFAGAPFTLAAYLVEGGPSKDYLAARALMHSDPTAWHELCDWLARISAAFLTLQVEAGASAVQLFDSWAGALSPSDYRAHALPASRQALDAITAVPRIHFGVGTGELLADMATIDSDAIGVDYRVPLDVAVERIGRPVTVQGNLDPAMLFAPKAARDAAIVDVLARGLAARAQVFNLGHGVPPNADPDVLSDVVHIVHEWRSES